MKKKLQNNSERLLELRSPGEHGQTAMITSCLSVIERPYTAWNLFEDSGEILGAGAKKLRDAKTAHG